jgi:hypothetical protein
LRKANAATHIEQIQVSKIGLSYQASEVSKKDFSIVLYTGRQYIGRVPLNFFGNVNSLKNARGPQSNQKTWDRIIPPFLIKSVNIKIDNRP